ncbi:MAG: sugar ABC transporter substrate-binding protein [Microbacterium sp.]
MKRSSLTFSAAAIAAVLLLAGCSGGSGTPSTSASGDAAADQPLAGKLIGVAVVGTQHFWDREAFQGAVDEIERLGGEVLTTDGGRDNTVHAENHEIFLSQQVDAVITILGDASVDPKLKELSDAGIPVFGIDHASEYAVNNAQSDNDVAGTEIARILGDALDGEGKVAVFNAFGESLSFCGERYDAWRAELEKDYPDVEILQPELAEQFSNAPQDAAEQTLALLERYPVGELDAIHVACWDQPAIGVVQAIEEAGRTDVKVTAIDAGPETLEIMAEDGSPFIGNIAQLPRKIATVSAQNVAKYFQGEDVPKVSLVDVIPVAGPEEAKSVYEELGYGD